LWLVAGWSAAAEPDRVEQDRQILQAAGVDPEDAGLLQFFRTRTLQGQDLTRIQSLIRDLGDESFEVREKASVGLVELGPVAEAHLKEAARSTDPEVKKRAEECLGKLARGSTSAVAHAAARLLAARKAAGAVEVLLNYLPFVADESTAEAVCNALSRLAAKDGKAEPLLIAGLADKLSIKRVGAARALLRSGLAEVRPGIRKLLHDPESTVRLQVALLLVEEGREPEGVALLIDMIPDAPPRQRWDIEDLLGRIAGEKAPDALKGTSDRKQIRDAWSKWWKENGEKIDLVKLELLAKVSGRTLIVERNRTPPTSGRVYEIDRDGKVQWEIGGLRVPNDARLVGEDRVLICEATSRRVTQRSLKGEVLWEYQVSAIVQSAQPLANGNVFVTCRNALIELDKDGKEVSRKDLAPTEACYAAAKTKDGRIGMVSATGKFTLLSPEGKEVKNFQAERPYVYGGIEVLKDGGLILASYTAGKVLRYDADGKVVWESAVPSPSAVSLLPNGNCLVTNMVGSSIIELDREGKEVRKISCQGRPYKAYGK
jgi:hypothetical protein